MVYVDFSLFVAKIFEMAFDKWYLNEITKEMEKHDVKSIEGWKIMIISLLKYLYAKTCMYRIVLCATSNYKMPIFMIWRCKWELMYVWLWCNVKYAKIKCYELWVDLFILMENHTPKNTYVSKIPYGIYLFFVSRILPHLH